MTGSRDTTGDGLFFVNSRVRIADVFDCMTNTIAIGERAIPKGLYWGWGLCGASTLDAYLSMQHRFSAGNDSGAHDNHFWSRHVGGAHFLLVDGSVRFISHNTDHQTMIALSTRAKSELTSEF